MLLSLFVFLLPASLAASEVTDLRCESLTNPLGIAEKQPLLSWRQSSPRRGARQAGYQILVASKIDLLKYGMADLWDSGLVSSDQSQHIPYQGKPLGSGQQCYWKVQIIDEQATRSPWSQPASWTMGLLNPKDWKGHWIGLQEKLPQQHLDNCQWLVHPDDLKNSPSSKRFFRFSFNLPSNQKLRYATLELAAQGEFQCAINGEPRGGGKGFSPISIVDLTPSLQPGPNLLALWVDSTKSQPRRQTAIAGRLKFEFESGPSFELATSSAWKTSTIETPAWAIPSGDETGWVNAHQFGHAGCAPWGPLLRPSSRKFAARMLRKDFSLPSDPVKATAYFSGLGLSELYLNGRKVGDHVLSPGLTDYDKRVLYVTHDVTDFLHEGPNAIGALLGNGRFHAPRGSWHMRTRTFGQPRLLAQLEIEFADGTSSRLVTDESWSVTNKGPIQANNEYDGETYDARLEQTGWTSPGFNDSSWSPCNSMPAPKGKLTPQNTPPLRVIETIRPVSIKATGRNQFLVDFGQNFAGWCRLKAHGPRGTTISLRHGEHLNPDGTLALANLRSAKATDHYTLRGGSNETYGPRFTIHGFRYVEVSGYPGDLNPDSILGCVVHDDLRSTGSFSCSNALLNQVYKNIKWGLRSNYRSIPTDCPQRDERQGWLGDRATGCRGESYLFDVSTFYRKWMQDIADSQDDQGRLPDVAPAFWPVFTDNVALPRTAITVPAMLHDQYGDTKTITTHYTSLTKWIEHMLGYVEDGLISRDTYGDWCLPPQDPSLIHAKDNGGPNASTIYATSLFHHALTTVAQFASRLNKVDDEKRYLALAQKTREAFHAKFFDPEIGYYGNGSPSSNLLPLALGLAPKDQHQRVFTHLTNKISSEAQGHPATGMLGSQWIYRTLTDGGRADLAFQMATKNSYPSWGYMIDQGATTIWELWNGNTAKAAMNSRNHLLLCGDFLIWLHEDLAGINPDPAKPGFKHIILKPKFPEGLSFVQATHDTPYGTISSKWERQNNQIQWKVIIPPNTTASIQLPGISLSSMTEKGRSLRDLPGITHVNDVLIKIQSGSHQFDFPISQ